MEVDRFFIMDTRKTCVFVKISIERLLTDSDHGSGLW